MAFLKMTQKDANKLFELKDKMRTETDISNIESLFHFTSIDTLYSIINNKTLRLTSHRYLNDRNEYLDFFEILKRRLKLNKDYVENEKTIDFDGKIDLILSNNSYSSSYIFSTCKSEALLPMWSLYAQENGICVEFDRVGLEKMFNDSISEALGSQKVWGNNQLNSFLCVYETKKKEEIVDMFIEHLLSNKLIDKANNDFILGYISEYAHGFKDELFSYENEVRYVITILNKDEINKKVNKDLKKGVQKGFISINNTVRPFITLLQLNNDRLPIKRILISPFNNNETTKSGIKEFLDYHGYENVEIEKMESSARLGY